MFNIGFKSQLVTTARLVLWLGRQFFKYVLRTYRQRTTFLYVKKLLVLILMSTQMLIITETTLLVVTFLTERRAHPLHVWAYILRLLRFKLVSKNNYVTLEQWFRSDIVVGLAPTLGTTSDRHTFLNQDLVGIRCHRAAHYLRKSIYSVLLQTILNTVPGLSGHEIFNYEIFV